MALSVQDVLNQIEHPQKFYEKSFDDVINFDNLCKEGDCKRIVCNISPSILSLATDILKKKYQVSKIRLQVNSIAIGSSRIQINEQIVEIKKYFRDIIDNPVDDDGLRKYERMKKQEVYDFSTLRSGNPISLSIAEREVGILSELSVMLGMYAYSLFEIAYFIGIQDSIGLAESHKKYIDNEIIHFWKYVARRYRRFTEDDF